MITQTAEYALCAVIRLASRPDVPQTTRQIAEATCIPACYLSKVLQSLSKAGIIASHRGTHGGFVLLREADQLSMLEVIQAIDPLKRAYSCSLKVEGQQTLLCPLHRKLRGALAYVEMSFRGTTIAELLDAAADGNPFCVCAESAR